MKFSISTHLYFSCIKVCHHSLDALVAVGLKSEMVAAINNGEKNILLDLSACSSCDASGLKALLLGNRICNEAKGKLALLGINKEFMEMIKLAGIDRQLTIASSETEAAMLLQ